MLTLHRVESNQPQATSIEPSRYTATYVSRTSNDKEGRDGRCYWMELEVEYTPSASTPYQAKVAIETPAQESFAAALRKLAEWAAATAKGIEEAGELPDHGFPAVLRGAK